jgi:hypothetical protein
VTLGAAEALAGANSPASASSVRQMRALHDI